MPKLYVVKCKPDINPPIKKRYRDKLWQWKFKRRDGEEEVSAEARFGESVRVIYFLQNNVIHKTELKKKIKSTKSTTTKIEEKKSKKKTKKKSKILQHTFWFLCIKGQFYMWEYSLCMV